MKKHSPAVEVRVFVASLIRIVDAELLRRLVRKRGLSETENRQAREEGPWPVALTQCLLAGQPPMPLSSSTSYFFPVFTHASVQGRCTLLTAQPLSLGSRGAQTQAELETEEEVTFS